MDMNAEETWLAGGRSDVLYSGHDKRHEQVLGVLSLRTEGRQR